MGIVYIWHSDMVGKVTKMELIIYGIDNYFKVEFCIANKGMNFSHFPLQIIQIFPQLTCKFVATPLPLFLQIICYHTNGIHVYILITHTAATKQMIMVFGGLKF